MNLGSLLANYDVKPLSKFGGNQKNRTITMSHPLSVSWDTDLLKNLEKAASTLSPQFIKARSRLISGKAGHARPQKHRVVYNFLSFYSVIVKLGTKKSECSMFFVFEIFSILENDEFSFGT